ncbi:chemotaxis protein CheX [Candidatus Hydrogenedentota bacterium]
MSNSNPEEIYSDTVREVLESMAFVFTDPVDASELAPGPGPFFKVSMHYTGPQKGCLGLAAPVSLAIEMGANMLGADESEDTGLAADALKELLNIICGQFLTRYYGETPIFDLSVPLIQEIERAEWGNLATTEGALLLEADESQIIASYSVEPA